MGWVREAARIAAKGAKFPLVWKTPTGLVVKQAYRCTKDRRIKTVLGAETYRPIVKEMTDKFDTRKQVQAIPPNFIHSMDASALCLTLHDCGAKGMKAFAAIHDSYGCLPAEMTTLMQSLRACFVRMYSEHDILEELRRSLQGVADLCSDPEEIPPVPAKGNLDISLVLESEFFFA
jgi:DNA-directed RNA polymerase